MKNYRDSDYAINKYSNGITYRFNNETVTVTPDAYLAENPGRTEQDFQEMKALSDDIYKTQDRAEYNQTRKNVSIHSLEENHVSAACSVDNEYIERLDRKKIITAFKHLMESGLLTETQRRRISMIIIDGLSRRQAADIEGVHKKTIDESVNAVLVKLKKYF